MPQDPDAALLTVDAPRQNEISALVAQKSEVEIRTLLAATRDTLLNAFDPSRRDALRANLDGGGYIGATTSATLTAQFRKFYTLRAALRIASRTPAGTSSTPLREQRVWVTRSARPLPNGSVAVVMRRPLQADSAPSDLVLLSPTAKPSDLVGALAALKRQLSRDGAGVARATMIGIASATTSDSLQLALAQVVLQRVDTGAARRVPIAGVQRGAWSTIKFRPNLRPRL